MGKKEKGIGCTADARPFDASHLIEIGRSERKRSTIEQNGSTTFVQLPQAASIGAILAPTQQVAMLIHSAELQYSLLVDDKFLIHSNIGMNPVL